MADLFNPESTHRRKAKSGDTSVPGAGAQVQVPGIDEAARSRNSNLKRDSARTRRQKKLEQSEKVGIKDGQGALFQSAPIESVGPDYGYRRLRLHKSEEVNVYAEQRDEQTGMDFRFKFCVVSGVLLLLALLLAIILPTGFFTINLRGASGAEWLGMFRTRVAGFVGYLTGQHELYGMNFIANKYVIIAFAGAALALSGAVYQGSLRNALASPTTLGVMSGANAGRIIYVLFFVSSVEVAVGGMRYTEISELLTSMASTEYAFYMYGVALCSLGGALIVVMLVLLISFLAGKGSINNIMMVVAGQVFASVLNVGISLIQYYFVETGDSRLELLRSLQTESFSSVYTLLDLALVAVPITAGIAIVLALRSRLNLLAFNDAESRSMGLSTTKTRWIIVLTCTVLTAIVVAFCGQIGMIGFFIPHLVRRFVGPDFRYLLPASALFGAFFLVLAYYALSMFEDGIASSLGVFTSVVGGVIFLYTAVNQKGGTRGDWLR